jgi:hypothetical protein
MCDCHFANNVSYDREDGNQDIRPNMASKHGEELLVSRSVLNMVVEEEIWRDLLLCFTALMARYARKDCVLLK